MINYNVKRIIDNPFFIRAIPDSYGLRVTFRLGNRQIGFVIGRELLFNEVNFNAVYAIDRIILEVERKLLT